MSRPVLGPFNATVLSHAAIQHRRKWEKPYDFFRYFLLCRMILFGYIALVLVVWFTPVTAQNIGRSPRIAILEFGNSLTAKRAADTIALSLLEENRSEQIQIVDRDLARVAARGVGYTGSLNLTIQEARDLGAAIGCDFYLLGDAQTLRRSPSSGPAYFESYVSVFLVSARTGKLISCERPSFEAATPEAAEQLLLSQISNAETQRRYLEEQLRLLTIISPVTGVVATPSRQLKELPGQLIRKGDLVAKVYEMDTIAAQLVISEDTEKLAREIVEVMEQ